MSSKMKTHKLIPDKFKHIAFGYTRQSEKEYDIPNLPKVVIYLVLGYFFHGEYFEKCGDDLQISDDKMTVKRTTLPRRLRRFWNTAYGKLWIPLDSNKVTKWTFKIESYGNEIEGDGAIRVGIVSKDNSLNQNFIGLGRVKLYEFGKSIRLNSFCLKLDPSNKSISVDKSIYAYREFGYVHAHELFAKEDGMKFKLAISMSGFDAKITLIDFCMD